jgi:hypothetical protein
MIKGGYYYTEKIKLKRKSKTNSIIGPLFKKKTTHRVIVLYLLS